MAIAPVSVQPLDLPQERVQGWGGAVQGQGKVLRPKSTQELEQVLRATLASGSTLGFRGSGCSYGDASMNTAGYLLDLKGLNKILSFNPQEGVAKVQPGVTIRELWQHSIPHGFWPQVVPGTMEVSIGGAAAMNIHGKNNFCAGSFGEHIRSFELLTASGDKLSCSRDQHSELFHGAIGGFGMLGCITEIELSLKRVHSGRLQVFAVVAKDLAHQIELFEDLKDNSDYLVSWLDLHAKGSKLGCGLIHRGVHLQAGQDPEGQAYLHADRQKVPGYLFGVYPKSWLWPGMWLAMKVGMVPWINAAKMRAGGYEESNSPYLQSHGAFHFLLDYVPRWNWMTKPGGLIQFQPFVPKGEAVHVLGELIALCHEAKLIPYLGVLKRHRKDPFLMTHAVDGYSLAMDFAVSTDPNRKRALWKLCDRMADRVLQVNGKFYYAKDATLGPGALPRVHGEATLSQFRALKSKYDPAGILQSDLSRRLQL